MHAHFLDLQARISAALSALDGEGTFSTDTWQRQGGGGGTSRAIAEGAVFEKGGVNVSSVHGEMPEAYAREVPGEGRAFLATGISLVIHPRSPHVPAVHANFRYLEKGSAAWFGGGADLTPWILYEEDAVHFHRVLKDACLRHAAVADHARLKRWCDEYFFLPHRGETRGVGGIFFDWLGTEAGADLDAIERFVLDAGASFLDAYPPIVERRKRAAWTDQEREWQLHRRGRYVEFNLLYDRGTTFGLKTGGRTESILMSLPSLVRWSYQHEAVPGTYQSALVGVLEKPRDWV